MKKLIYSLIILAAGAQLAAAGQPRISIPVSHWEFGLVPASSKAIGRYMVKNIGDDTLRIISVKPGCGCTSVPDFKRMLAPNDSTEVGLIFDSSHGKGGFRKSAQIITNDSTHYSTSISFGGTIIPSPDSISPVSFSDMKVEFEKTGPKEISIELTNHGERTIRISPLSQNSNLMAANIKDQELKPGHSGKIEFEWRGDFEEKDKTLSMTFQMSGSDTSMSRFTIPVVARGTNPAAASKIKTEAVNAAAQTSKINEKKNYNSNLNTNKELKAAGTINGAHKITTIKTVDRDTTKAVAK